MNTVTKGTDYERLAATYLRSNGLQVIETNFRCKAGEVDLICMDGISLVFVEVKMRSSMSFGGALAAVTPTKQTRLRRTANFYLTLRNQHSCECRFDVVAIQDSSGSNADIEWISNAF